MHGYAGSYLRINLTDQSIRKEKLPEHLMEYIGGTGFCARILWDELKAGIEPLSPENILVLATGPTTGTLFPQSGRYMMATKSPLTGGWAEAHCGGHLGPELKYAGYDFIIFEGRAEKLVYLLIKDDEVKLIDASAIKGKTVNVTTDYLRDKHGIERVACIGPAGENLVRFAAVMTDKHRAFGRSGLGTVMGNKNLKAIAVLGTKDLTVADPERFGELFQESKYRFLEGPDSEACLSLREFGTAGLVEIENEIGRLPTRNHKMGVFDQVEAVGSTRIRDEFRVAKNSCFNCKIQCKLVTLSKKYNSIGEGPEYETVVSLGTGCFNSDLDSLIYANHLCNDLGMDTISCGSVISFAMECHENGLIKEEVNWSDSEKIVQLVKDIAYRRGLGDLLAEGVKRASEKIGGGAEKFAMHVKGQEISGQDGRAHRSSGLTHATSVRGADHLRGLSVIDEIGYPEIGLRRYGEDKLPAALDRHSEEFKGQMVYDVEHFYAVVDSLILCKYGTMYPLCYYYPDFPDILYSLTGIETFNDEENLKRIGKRICVLRRAFNQREGMSRKDDTLPDRFLKEPEKEGPAKGEVVHLDVMLDDYYRLWGYDDDGLIRPETLNELGLEDVRKELYPE
ncbi:MAG: aldehyde ferredoxin oxidoreductase family protein [Candidatus Euphemobacter frigidus]|nr:aldehyde ferredoxin oxidoreductase family protein [Candidatus Euphemobacter frigidus]MDP8275354.1 aldehyde ferredoxin oxidoreductase family protein [Candidatus Euphemobacter frigidus]